MTDSELRVFEKQEIACRDVVKLMGDYHDDDLPLSLRARVDAHIEACGRCQHFVNTYNRTIDIAGELREAPVPTDVQNRLRQALNKRLGLSIPMVSK